MKDNNKIIEGYFSSVKIKLISAYISKVASLSDQEAQELLDNLHVNNEKEGI